jgi:hypothetical protein
MRRTVCVRVETLELLDRLTAELASLPEDRLRFRRERGRKAAVSRARVADEAIERGIKVMREEYGL